MLVFCVVVQTIIIEGYDFTISSPGTKKKLSELYLQTNHLFKYNKWLKANTCYQVNILF